MNILSIRLRLNGHLLAVFVAMIASVLLSIAFFSQTSYGLKAGDMSNLSPNPANMLLGGEAGDHAWHNMVFADNGIVKNIELGFYFDSNGAKIVNLNRKGLCVTEGTSTMTVSFDNDAGDKITYEIPKSNVCSGFGTNTPSNKNNAYLDGSFVIPANIVNASKDSGPASTGSEKYKIRMTVKLQVSGDNSKNENETRLRFTAKGTSGSSVGYINANKLNNSTLGNQNNDESSRMTQLFPFGRACTYDGGATAQTVSVYDSDNGMGVQSSTRVRFYIGTTNSSGVVTPLDQRDYGESTSGLEGGSGSTESGIYMFTAKDGVSSGTATVTIKQMAKQKKYVLVITGIHAYGNFLYVGLPGDSIFGDPDFDCPGWDATPKTIVNPNAVQVGGTINWTHTVDNDGPDKTDKDINWEVRRYEIIGGTSGPKSVVATGIINSPKAPSLILNRSEDYIAKNSDLGKKICQEIRIKPESSDNNSWQTSTPKCAKVEVDGDFIPSVLINEEASEPGTAYNWYAKVTDGVIPVSTWPEPEPYNVTTTPSSIRHNQFATQKTKTEEITWEVHKIVYQPSDGSAYNNSSTGSFVCPSGTECTKLDSPPGHARESPGGDVKLEKYPDILDSNLESGSRICYVSSVYLPPETTITPHWDFWYDQPYDVYDPETGEYMRTDYVEVFHWVSHLKYVANRDWRHSEQDCITVGKRPRVQVLGGDLSVGGLISVGTSSYADEPKKTFGSWVEYAALSGKVNKFMASGAALSGGKDPIVNRATWSRLTFANTDDTAYGNFSLLSDAPQLREYYSRRTSGPWLGGSLGNQKGVYSVDNNNVTLSGSGVTGSIVIVSSDTVTIDGDISYNNGPYSSFNALPQVIIIAKHIIITKDVRNIDAWLVTTGSDGSIITCNEVGVDEPLSNDICSNKLTVNGPVMTGNLYLRRTAGAKNESTRGDPAEVFNFRPDAYLWAYHQNLTTTGSTPRTVELTELPPRY